MACTAAVLIIGGGGAAFAYWSSSGAGTGTATTGTSSAFVVTTDPPTGDPLVPGGDPQTIAFTVSNPSDVPLTLTSVVVTVANTDGTEWLDVIGCSADDYTLGTPVVTFGEIAGGADVAGTVTVSMVNSGSNQDACKDEPVPLYFVAG